MVRHGNKSSCGRRAGGAGPRGEHRAGRGSYGSGRRDLRETLRISRPRPEPLDLLLTDAVMPGTNGRELAGCLRVFRPGIEILFMSAHSAETVERFGIRVAPVERRPAQ